MDAAARPLDLSCAPTNFIVMLLQSLSLRDRFTCALVCKAWAEAATAATRSIALEHKVQDLSCLQRWLEQHGKHLDVLQLHDCDAALTALPCPQLQNLLLKGRCSIDSHVWSNIAAATKLTFVSLEGVETASPQAEVVSALTALPDLEQLSWSGVACGQQRALFDSMLLQKLTKLHALKLEYVAEAQALEHLGVLTGLEDLSLAVTKDWAAAGCPGLRELKALTRVQLLNGVDDIPDSVSHLTALQQLDVIRVTPTALNKLQALTGLTQLCVTELNGLSSESAPLQLPGLQHLKVADGSVYWYQNDVMPVSFLASCTQLRVLKLGRISLSPGSLAASTMLQHLELRNCEVSADDEAAGRVSWQQVFPGPGQLPHLTSLKLEDLQPNLQQADINVVACYSSLQVLHLDSLPDDSASALARLPGLTSLTLWRAANQQCGLLAQLSGLRELRVRDATGVAAAVLQQLTALGQLTSLGLGSYGLSSHVLAQHMSDKLPKPFKYLWQYVIINKVCECAGEGCRGGILHPDCW